MKQNLTIDKIRFTRILSQMKQNLTKHACDSSKAERLSDRERGRIQMNMTKMNR